MKVQYYGKVMCLDEWGDFATETVVVDIPNEIHPFDYFKMIMGDTKYLITYNIIKEE